ncbi:MAG TPA: hypothetical protein VGC14_02785 [Rhizobium sp.]
MVLEAFQAEYAGSIPATRSSFSNFSYGSDVSVLFDGAHPSIVPIRRGRG